MMPTVTGCNNQVNTVVRRNVGEPDRPCRAGGRENLPRSNVLISRSLNVLVHSTTKGCFPTSPPGSHSKEQEKINAQYE
jgi:hypothetical protein